MVPEVEGYKRQEPAADTQDTQDTPCRDFLTGQLEDSQDMQDSQDNLAVHRILDSHSLDSLAAGHNQEACYSLDSLDSLDNPSEACYSPLEDTQDIHLQVVRARENASESARENATDRGRFCGHRT